MSAESTGGGFGIGAVIAAILSWTTWHSVLWTILHLFCGWFYVIYWLIVRPHPAP